MQLDPLPPSNVAVMSAPNRAHVLSESIGIIGAGPAGLINAHVLVRDGFTNVNIITRDGTVGGVWARERIYPGLRINNVHGEYRFSSMEMPPPSDAASTGGRLSGLDLCNYMESYYENFLKGKANFSFNTEVLDLSRQEDGKWLVQTENTQTHTRDNLSFFRIILATGGCSEPEIPHYLSPDAAAKSQYRGIVIHSSEFASNVDRISEAYKTQTCEDSSVVVIGGGKSAQEFLAVLSPHIHLRTRLERFLHGTTLGGKIVQAIWSKIQSSSFEAFQLPSDSPLRKTYSMYWGVRTNDVGAARPDSYHALANAKKIDIIAPARAMGFAQDGRSVLLNDGRSIPATAVILATGYSSSWDKIFSDKTAEEIGINKHVPSTKIVHAWDYPSLSGAPQARPDSQNWVTSIYRGIVPAKNILRRDFAIAGAHFTANIGYTNEVVAHWISSYFLGDDMNLPSSAEEAIAEAERSAAWMKKRYPTMDSWVNASYMGSLDFWNWPQAVDDLLEDMRLPIHRSGGSWLTWPLKVIDLKEIASLGDERRVKRLETGHRLTLNRLRPAGQLYKV
ncbi:hypothetical protein NP233_g1053 [Leucocoprinus birnbaumii]|uniref:FAD/NAD(P)-binding domain-containing protein n=1 Tax=Leucocoprinus birnbaumii TaxID=56174 RepID=A0AAD5W2Y8_9AGAR|nr:hypothetical protein NP233_g1053 [Leucocoprinus birnbaumii]